ncbi:MAG: HYR domain-containing protein [Flavobacteriales bacterium]|nr:HYR domain-containing protein [Flavobacteriales bacterium]
MNINRLTVSVIRYIAYFCCLAIEMGKPDTTGIIDVILTMKKLYFLFVLTLVSIGVANAQTVTQTWTSPVSSTSINNVGNYGTTLPAVTFSQGMFSQGCVISDVDVVINWAKTAGTCSSPTGGASYHGETSYRVNSPLGNEILAVPGTWSGNATTNSVTTTFSQQAANIPSGTPVTGTFRPNNGNLNTYNGQTPFGNWSLSAGDNGPNAPLCVTYYQVKVTTAPDNTNPTFTSFPSNITLPASNGQCTAPVSWTTPTASDQCGVTVTQIAGHANGDDFALGSTTVTYRAEDTYGNFVDQSFTVTIVDTQNPTISCPSDLTANAPLNSCSATVSYTTPAAADNCYATASLLSGSASGSSFPVGVTTVVWRATDLANNTADCSFTVTVFDIEDPQITCPNNISTVSTTGNCGAVINYTTPVGTDNCSGSQTILTGGYASGSTFPSGNTTVTYQVVDASGNTDNCSFTVNVDPVPNGALSLSPSPICQGSQTDVTFTFTSGTPPFNVTITDGINTYNVNGVQSGDSYSVTPPTTVTYSYTAIQDATGCVRTSGFLGTAQVVVTPIPVVTFTGLDPVYCETEAPVTLTGSQNGGTFYSLDAALAISNTGPGTATFNPAAAGPTGPYNITYTFTDINNCTDSQTQQVSVDEQPAPDAGSGSSECDLNYTFAALPSVGTGTWTLVSGPGTPLFSNINSPTCTVQVSAYGTYVFRWTEVNGQCSDYDEVTVNFYEVPTPNPGFGGGECDLDFQFGATPSVGTGTWTASGPGSATYSPDASEPNAVVTVDTYGTYVFTWTEDNNGCTNSASISVQFDELPVADAGSGGDECDLNFTFSAVPSVGNGLWTANGPGLATYSSASDPTGTVTVSNYGTYTFTWTETNGNCSSVDQITVNFYEQPVADAGAGGSECYLDHTFSANPSVGNGQWTQINGPGTSTFADDTDPTTSVTVDQYGSYTYTWTETNGTCSDSETITVDYYEQPVADAGTGGDECDLNFTFNGTASVGVGLWTSTGPGTATFTNDLDVNTDVTVSAYGTYTFTWTEINGTCSDAASVTVNFYEQPVADAGVGGDECDLNFLLQATPSVGTGAWAMTSGPGSATFTNSSSPITTVTVDTYGTYDFTWTETNGSCSDSRSVSVNFYEQPVADAGTGGDECDFDFVFSAVPSVGNGVWTATGPGTASYVDDTDPTTTVTVSQSGTYTFTWTETNGTCADDDIVVVNFYDQPVADAGLGGDECDLNFVFNGTASYGTGTWTYSGPGNAFFANAHSATTTVTVDTYGSYDFTWTEVNGPCSDNATITVNFYQQPIANAGQGGSECDLDFIFGATPSVGNGVWTYSGPGTAVFSPADTDPNATVTVDATGSYTFTWTEDNNGCTDSEDITVVFNPLPVVSFTGLAANYCIDQTTPVPLTGTPTGGQFTGLGISGNSFVPSVAGVGTIFITYTYTDVNGCTDSETQSVDVNGLPVVSFTGLSAEYCEDDAVAYTLTGSPVGGNFTGPGTSANTFTPADAGAGVHTIEYTYTDPFGCTSFQDQSVTINQLPVVSFTGLAPAYCANASTVPLIGSPTGGTFSGTGVQGSSFNPVTAGVGSHTVTYTYTDGNGCTNSLSQQVTVNPVPLPVITPSGISEICAGDNLVLDAGSGYANYSWSNTTNGQTTTVTAAGNYNVTVTTFEGCTATSAAVQVVVNQPPVVDLGNDTTICTNSVLTLDAGNPGSTYYWSTTEVSQTINVTTTAAYTVQVTDGNGCVGTDNISVTVAGLLDPVIVASGPLNFCSGECVTLDVGAGYATYQWSTSDQGQSITVCNSDEIEVTVTDQFGCNGSDQVVVATMQLPNAVISPSGPIEVCSGDSVTLNATANFTNYVWSPGTQNTPSIVVTQSGSYSVTVEDPNNGCTATSDPVEVIINSSVPPTIVASGPTEFCFGESVSLSVQPGPYNSYLWCSGSTTPSIVVTQTGDYCVTVLDANDCLDSSLVANPLHVEVWHPQPQPVQQGDSLLVPNDPFASYQWFLNGAPIAGATNYIYVPASSGNYRVEVTDDNGCIATSYNLEFTFTGIMDLEAKYQVEVYPNPTLGEFVLQANFGGTMDVTITLSDVAGRDLLAPEFVSSVSSLRRTFDIASMSGGVYYVKIVTDEGSVVKPIMKGN